MDNTHHNPQQDPGEASGVVVGTSAMAAQYAYDRDRLEYELVVRQEPKQARMCGVGGKADRRPIDPPPIVQLRVIDPSCKHRPSTTAASGSGAATPADSKDAAYTQSFLQNPYYFMFASLAKPDDEGELHWLKDGRTRCTTGSVVSSLYHLKDPQNNNEDAGFFVFPDLSVRTEGSYRLKLSLFEVVGNTVRHCKSIYSAPFYVYTAKKFPGMEESTPLSCSLADQGIKIRIRKDIRVRKRPIHALEPLTQPLDGPSDDRDDDDQDDGPDGKLPQAKRTRLDNSADEAVTTEGNGVGTSQQSQPWPPPASIDPSLGPVIPPPPNAQIAQNIPPPPGATHESGTSSTAISSNTPTPYDNRASAYTSYDPHPQSQPPAQPSHTQSAPSQYRSDPSQLHQPASQQQIPPPPSQQPYAAPPPHPPPPTQHMPPPSHMPPPTSHVQHHAVPPGPPVQQPYGYPSQPWPAPPQPQPMYDPYAHYHHPQHPPPPHYPTMPPAPPTMHMQHARYDYAPAMYAQPHAAYSYPSYYDQPPPPPPPPHPHQAQHPQQYPPVPTGSSTSNNTIPPSVAPPNTMPPPAPPTSYVDYGAPYARATSSPQPRGYHAHAHPQAHYGPYPPPLPPHPQHQPPRHYAPLHHPYGYAYGPPPGPDQWGAAAYPHSWADYGAPSHPQPQPQSTAAAPAVHQPPAPSAAGPSSSSLASGISSSSSGLLGAIGGPNDRIQLAPIRPTISTGVGASSVTTMQDSSPGLAHAHAHAHAHTHGIPDSRSSAISSASGSGSAGTGYPMMHHQSSARGAYDAARDDRDDRGEREHERMGGRKKNLLSIGSIISNE